LSVALTSSKRLILKNIGENIIFLGEICIVHTSPWRVGCP
jgi:hypothetical protein